MKTLYVKALTILLISLAMLTACNAPTDSGENNPESSRSMGDLNIPANFDWKTQKDITFSLVGYQTGAVRLIAEDGTVYHHANLVANNEYAFKLTVPAYMNEITAVYRGQQVEFNLNRSEIEHTFEPQNF